MASATLTRSPLRHVWRASRKGTPHQTPLPSIRVAAVRTFYNTSNTAPHLRAPRPQSRSTNFTPCAHQQPFSTSKSNMVEFEKIILDAGNGSQKPTAGQTVTMEYTGWLYDPSKPDNKGNQFDSSVGRGDFQTAIGVGRVIQGWDEGVTAMNLGEKARLIIPGHMAYGSRGFPGAIPPNATLIFDVHLKRIS